MANRHTKRCSTLLTHQGNAKSIMMYHLIPVRMAVLKKTINRGVPWLGFGLSLPWPRFNPPIFIAALFTVAVIWKKSKFINRWTDEDVWGVCVYQIAIKNKEILTSATTWMDLEGIMLREIRAKDRCCMFSTYMWNLKIKTNQ